MSQALEFFLMGFCGGVFGVGVGGTVATWVAVRQFRNILKQSGYMLDTKNRIVALPVNPLDSLHSFERDQ